MNFDLLETSTSRAQRGVEYKAAEIYSGFITSGAVPKFDRKAQVAFVCNGLHSLPAQFVCLESGRPWLLYWMLHSLSLMKALTPANLTVESKSLGPPSQLLHYDDLINAGSLASMWTLGRKVEMVLKEGIMLLVSSCDHAKHICNDNEQPTLTVPTICRNSEIPDGLPALQRGYRRSSWSDWPFSKHIRRGGRSC